MCRADYYKLIGLTQALACAIVPRAVTSQSIGARIKATREARQIKRIELAVAAGLTSNTIRNYEEGFTKVPADNLGRIAEILEADVRWLIEGEELVA